MLVLLRCQGMAERPKKQISKKTVFIFLVLFFGSYLFLRFWNMRFPEATIVLKEERLTVEVARTPEQWYKGLSGRETIGTDGMLFFFSKAGEHAMVMRNMQFPIDIVWLDHSVVVDIAPSAPPEPEASEEALFVYQPRVPATMVLELSAGWAEAHGLQVGDKMEVISD